MVCATFPRLPPLRPVSAAALTQVDAQGKILVIVLKSHEGPF